MLSPRMRRRIAVLTAITMLFSLQLVPVGEAQQGSSLPSSFEQQRAANDLLSQLDDIVGSVDVNDVTLDPALGPPPWISYVPGRDQSTIDAWNELSTRLGDAKVAGPDAARFALPNAVPVVQDIEGVNDTGLNDTISTGQFVSGFGTGPGENGVTRVSGVLGGPLPPPPEAECPSFEDDGAIPLANGTPLTVPDRTVVLCGGVIGDGPFGDTSGDVDFFSLNAVTAGSIMTIDAGSFDPAAVFAVTTAIYNADGVLLGALDDSDSGPDSILAIPAPTDGIYYAAVAGVGTLPADPFDSGSGTGVSYLGDYLFFAIVSPAPPPPCVAVEPDSSIDQANVLGFAPGETAACLGVIGDGTFGDSTGDFDFFALDVAANSDVIVDIVPSPELQSSPATIALYDAAGTLLATVDDDGTGPDFLQYSASDAGTYYALVTSPGVLPGDPFDEASGSVAGPATPYTVFILSLPLLEPPPIEPEPPVPVPTPTPAPPLPDPVPGFANQPQAVPPQAMQPQARAMIEGAQQERAAAVEAATSPMFLELEGPCDSIEDDGAINVANSATRVDTLSISCFGLIGDGPFGATSGDFDFYSVFAQSGEALIADIDALPFGPLDSVLAIYDSAGNLLAENDDFDAIDSRVHYRVEADDTYFVAVFGYESAPADPFSSGSGNGVGSTGPYQLNIARAPFVESDTDVYLVDLNPGDVLGAGFAMGGTISIVAPFGQLGMTSGGSASIIYPQSSPLRHLGNVGVDFVAETAGVHAVIFGNGFGAYEGELRVKRAGLTDTPGDDAQIMFLDFDGGSFNQAIFDPFAPDESGPISTLSPLADFLPRWGLDAADESAVIDAIIAEFTENTLHDPHDSGINGNRDATGNGGETDLQILNSRDHADPWGQPNVSRIIIGGTIAEAGIATVGIAQSIDPGNFDTEETGIVLLDLLSEAAASGAPTLNDVGVQAPFTKIDLVGRGVGIIAAHEAGHFIGNWHTATFNGVPSVMDEGGDLFGTIGVGNDFVYGTADDIDTDFVTDKFSNFEGFLGSENTLVRTTRALSTGQTNVPVVPVVPDVPAPGVYNLRNVLTNRVLDADPNGNVDTSSTPLVDDQWELIEVSPGVYNLRNVNYDTYLDSDADGGVDQSETASSDDRWELIPAEANSYLLYSIDRGRYLSTNGNDVTLSFDQGAAQRWLFELVDRPNQPEPSDLVGRQIALQNDFTDRFLDTDSNNNVDTSVTQRADDVWRVEDAGEGAIYLVNNVTNRYLDSDGTDANVDTSSSPGDDDRWIVRDEGNGAISLRSAVYDAYLIVDGNNAVTFPDPLEFGADWQVIFIDNPA